MKTLNNKSLLFICSTLALVLLSMNVFATNYTVAAKANLQSKYTAALPGDTIIVANGTYDWGQLVLTNSNGTTTSNWIVIKAQTLNGVVFTGSTYMQFGGKRIMITGFKFANGNAGFNDVIQFRSSTSNSANSSYCRLNNITIENYSSDSTGAAAGLSTASDNKWVSIYGVHNRVDHCTFIDKTNGGATVVVWYDNSNYPQQSTSTYHLIDSNYFNKRSFISGNGGESIRVGVGNCSSTYGYNIVEYNLFENMRQTDPEVLSNKSGRNIYRYNTIKNCFGGITLRRGRYCSVYGNFIIVTDPAVVDGYGIRIIDKGHKVFNNYIEGVLGSKGSFTVYKGPISFYNGFYSINDTTDPNHVNSYMPSDSSTAAFNTIVNCQGGAGIYLGFTDNGSNLFQPQGLNVVNNLIKMTTGKAAYNPSTNTQLSYFAEGNIYNAPSSLGLTSSTGFLSASINFGTRVNGILTPPTLVQDAAVNTSSYLNLLNGIDVDGKTRSAIYDVGCMELNGTGTAIATPLDSTQVGAGTPVIIVPVTLVKFTVSQTASTYKLNWLVENEINFLRYEVEVSDDANNFKNIATVYANNQSNYQYEYFDAVKQDKYFRLKLIDKDGSFFYSNIVSIKKNEKAQISLYPNPAKHFISISLNKVMPNSKLIIVNNIGATIQQIQLLNNTTTISTNGLVNGIYFIQILENGELNNSLPFVILK
jgi:poly(beta-D-mannuronate) lyase